jgi:hypothetical protein
MTRDPLIRAWGLLVGLSVAGALITRAPDVTGSAALILAMAFVKARLILHHYLGLAGAPSWRRGFDMVVAGVCVLLAALALAA